jgi:hypothetical protein
MNHGWTAPHAINARPLIYHVSIRSSNSPLITLTVSLVGSLTHLNYAFGFLDPNTFEVITMDPDTRISLFSEVAQAKTYNPKLEVWLSIGGWTFSDDGEFGLRHVPRH